MRFSEGSIDSKCRTGCPASAWWSVRAARNIVSPSGMAPHLEAHRAGAESGLGQERCERMLGRRHAVDLRDEQPGLSLLDAREPRAPRRERPPDRRSCRLVLGAEDGDLTRAARD